MARNNPAHCTCIVYVANNIPAMTAQLVTELCSTLLMKTRYGGCIVLINAFLLPVPSQLMAAAAPVLSFAVNSTDLDYKAFALPALPLRPLDDTCNPLAPPPHASIEPMGCGSVRAAKGSQCAVQCAAGFAPAVAVGVTCSADKRWEPPTACAKVCPPPGSVFDML